MVVEIKGQIKKVGLLKGRTDNAEDMAVEIYKARYDLTNEETRQALTSNRHRAVREFLEANGHVVNSLHIAVAEDEAAEPVGDVQICDYAHIVSPPNRESGYIEFNCRPGVMESPT